jgi:hypothetical protein
MNLSYCVRTVPATTDAQRNSYDFFDPHAFSNSSIYL